MNLNPTESQPSGNFQSPPCFETVLQHWAKARIDAPLQILARFDDAAKQLISIGGILQALCIAVFAFNSASPRIPIWGILIIVPFILAFIFCAAGVICTLPSEMQAMGAYDLFKKIGTSGASDEELKDEVIKWCTAIEDLARKKHRWLLAANILFITSSVVTVLFVFLSMCGK